MRKTIVFLLAVTFSTTLWGGQVRGVVFDDRNANGVMDRGEKCIPDIQVSNGDTVVVTDKNGRYLIDIQPGEYIFPVTPSGYAFGAQGTQNGIMAGWLCDSSFADINFPLVTRAESDRFRIAAVGDTQYGDFKEFSYAARTVYSELAQRSDVDMFVFVGDMVNDASGLFLQTREMIDLLPSPSWIVPGNHDRGEALPRDFAEYRKVFGPENYAFHRGKVCFIALNDVRCEGSRGYDGYISESQQRFIRGIFAGLPEDRLVVIFQHIPLAGLQNKDQILEILKGRHKVLVLSGHTHTVGKMVLAPNICEQIVGTSCGTWWTGELDYRAIPLAIQPCGSPRNYFIVDFDADRYRLSFKGVGLDETTQMDVWIKDEELSDSSNTVFASYDPGTILVNIYGGCDATSVKMKVGDSQWQAMERADLPSPAVTRLADWNKTAGYPTKYSRRSPLRTIASPHVWKGTLPGEYRSGVFTVEVVAEDDYGLRYSGKRNVILK